MKIKIAVDIDGVLGDQVTPVLSKINDEQGLNLKKEDITQWKSQVGNKTIDVEIEEALLNEEYILSMPLIKSAQKALEDLSKSYHIIIATNRPKQTEWATIKWLQANFKFNEFYNTRNIGKHMIKADILIDDYINNLLDFTNKGRLGILFFQPWNSECSCLKNLIDQNKVYCCANWNNAVDTIRRIEIYPKQVKI